jgi:hypothetical protein
MKGSYDRTIIAVSLLALAAAACLQVRYPEPGRPVGTAEGAALAFGRIAVFDRGYEIELWNSDLRADLFAPEKPVIRLSLFHIEANRRAIDVRVEPDGSFFWILPTGTYLIYHSRVDRQPPNEPLSAFQVPSAMRAVYVGTLEMHIESDYIKETGRQDYDLVDIGVKDEFERAKQGLAARYPDIIAQPERKPMITDPLLRDLFRDYSKRACEKVLHQHGLQLLGTGAVQKN